MSLLTPVLPVSFTIELKTLQSSQVECHSKISPSIHINTLLPANSAIPSLVLGQSCYNRNSPFGTPTRSMPYILHLHLLLHQRLYASLLYYPALRLFCRSHAIQSTGCYTRMSGCCLSPTCMLPCIHVGFFVFHITSDEKWLDLRLRVEVHIDRCM